MARKKKKSTKRKSKVDLKTILLNGLVDLIVGSVLILISWLLKE